MKAAYFLKPHEVVVEDTQIPQIEKGEMLLKVKAAAVCGTDLRIFKNGHFMIPPGTKRVLGHELSGELVEIGSDVKGFNVGDAVVVIPNIGCGTCAMCGKGYNQLCPSYVAFGISIDGGFQEYMRVTKEAVEHGNILRIPGRLSFIEAAMVEPLSCVYSSYKMLRTKPGDTVLVIGAGPIGACHVMMSRLAGAAKVIVADISAARLSQVEKFGADVLVDSSSDDLLERVMQETDGLGMDVVITANSVPEIQTLSLELVASRGRVCLFGGMPKGKEMVSLNTNLIHYKEISVVATTGSSIADFKETLDIAASGRIPLKEIVTGEFLIENIKDAFDYASSGLEMKAVVAGSGKD